MTLRIALTLAACGAALAVSHAAEPKGTEVKFDKLVSIAPAAWKEVKSDNKLRFMEFSLPNKDDANAPAELVIFYFGEGGGGDIDANVKRWKGMFEPPPGKKLDDVFKKDEIKIGEHKATVVELNGTFLYKASPMDAKADPRPEHRMIAVIFHCPKGPYFIRLVGPEKTVAEHKKAFDEWLKNFK